MSRRSRDGHVAIGVDVGGTNVRAARVDRAGRLSGHVRVGTDSGSDPSGLVIDLCRALLDDGVVSIGVGIPGRLDRDRTTVISSGYVDLAGVRLGEVVEQAIGLPVTLENDAHVALLAELRLGAAAYAEHVVLFTVGTGIGGAVAMDRAVIRARGNAGQLGHLAIDPAGPACNCGRRGCSEVMASGTALNHLTADAGLGGTTAEALLERRQTDPVAADVLRRWASAWRDAIDTVIAVLDPDVVVLGGGLGRVAVTALEAYAPSMSEWFRCRIVPAGMGDDAGVIGAGLRALDG